MASVNIRISEKSRDVLKEISREDGCSIHQVADHAVESYRRRRLLEETNRAYAALRADKDAWAEESAERVIWDVAVSDGLEDS